jgi:hypothetical protein
LPVVIQFPQIDNILGEAGLSGRIIALSAEETIEKIPKHLCSHLRGLCIPVALVSKSVYTERCQFIAHAGIPAYLAGFFDEQAGGRWPIYPRGFRLSDGRQVKSHQIGVADNRFCFFQC